MQDVITRRATLGLASSFWTSAAARSLPVSLLAHPALAQPERVARIIVGAAPGGGTDTVARLLAERLSSTYAPQVVVENRTGASSRLAAEAVKAAAADGTTMLFGPMPVLTLFPHVLPRTTRYDPLTDFTAVATVGEVAYALAINAANPARDLSAFLSGARASGGVTFAPPVLGSPQHMLGLELAKVADVSFETITYRSSGQALQDLMAGRIGCMLSHMAELAPPARAGSVRLLAVSSKARLANFPEVSTFAEQGFPALTAAEAFSVMLPAGAQGLVVARLHSAIAVAIDDPALSERLRRLEIRPMVLTPAETADRLHSEFASWRPIVQRSGFRPEE
jgi:tripartite-type tricarboxylate transporter receptor subunit TctC